MLNKLRSLAKDSVLVIIIKNLFYGFVASFFLSLFTKWSNDLLSVFQLQTDSLDLILMSLSKIVNHLLLIAYCILGFLEVYQKAKSNYQIKEFEEQNRVMNAKRKYYVGDNSDLPTNIANLNNEYENSIEKADVLSLIEEENKDESKSN